MTEGEGLLSQLPSLDRLREACKRAREWWGRAEALLQQLENYPYLETDRFIAGSFFSSFPESRTFLQSILQSNLKVK